MTVRHLADVPQEELQLVGGVARAMHLSEVDGQTLQLRLRPGGRQWIIETDAGQVVANIADESSKSAEEEVLQVSERICRFGECFGGDTVSLLTPDGRTVIAYAAGTSAAIDIVPSNGEEMEPWKFVASSSAEVGMHRFRMLLWCAGAIPSGFQDTSYPRPPVWLQLGEGTVGIHVDWADFFPSSATYRMSATTHEGHGTVAVPYDILESVLRPSPHVHRNQTEATCTITIGSVQCEQGDRPALMLNVGGWRLIVWVTEPARERWAAKVEEVFALEGIEATTTDGIEWSVTSDFELRVKLRHGHPDVAHVRAVLLRDVEESVELFRELGQLNAASNHIRYWLDEGVVRSAVDVQCIALHRLPDIVRQVDAAAAKYAPMLAVLSSTA